MSFETRAALLDVIAITYSRGRVAILCLSMSQTLSGLNFTLPDEVRNELEALASTRREQPNAVLFRRGEPAQGVYVIRRGSVVLNLDDRRRQRASKGWILGLPATFSGKPYSATAITAEVCEFAFIPREKVIEFVRFNPALGVYLLEVLASEVSAVRGMCDGETVVY